jgi:ribosome-binding factor A
MRKVNSALREVLADEIELLDDPDMGLVTITGVDTRPDLRQATVFLSVLDQSQADSTLEVLEGEAGTLQAAIASQLRLKYTPRLTFRVDPAIISGEHIEKVLRRLKREDQANDT